MKVFKNFDLTKFNSYNTKSVCLKAYFPDTEEDIRKIFSTEKDIILIGSGHNIILSKPFYEQPFVILNGNFANYEINKENGSIIAEAGISMYDIAHLALELELSGLEMFIDIPSSLGGAIVMNAGASGEEIKDTVEKVRYLDLADFQIKELHKENLNFKYRNSFFQENRNNVVLKTWLKLKPGTKNNIHEKMIEIRDNRWEKQPKEYPNAGSVFKRPKGKFVGPMLDELSLRGFTVGGAQVSTKHSGFIVNFDHATGQDILDLIKEIQKKVKLTFNVNLEIEQRII